MSQPQEFESERKIELSEEVRSLDSFVVPLAEPVDGPESGVEPGVMNFDD